MGRRQDYWKRRASLALKRKEAKLTKETSFGALLQKKVNQINKRTEKNFVMYAKMCREQGKEIGEPVDIMSLLKKK